MKEYIFDEKVITENIIANGLVDNVNINKTIKKLARYNHYVQNLNPDENYNAIIEYMNKNCPDFSEVGSYSDIKGCIKDASKGVWKDIKQVIITKGELEFIQSLNDIRQEKLAFILLADAKYDNACKHINLNLSYLSVSDLYRLARVTMPIKDRNMFLNFLYDKKLVEININPNSTHKKLLYVGDDEDEVGLILNENNYKELAFTYMNWKNGGYKECKNCGRLFKIKKGNQIYCKQCTPIYEPQGYVTKICKCGVEFCVDSRNTTKIMCDECYKEHRKKKNLEAVKKYKAKI